MSVCVCVCVCARALSHVQLFCDPMDYSLADSSVHEISQASILGRLPFPPPRDLPNPGIKLASLASPVLAGGFFTTLPPGKPMKEGP